MNERLKAWYIEQARQVVENPSEIADDELRLPESPAVTPAARGTAWVTVELLVYGPMQDEPVDADGVPVDAE